MQHLEINEDSCVVKAKSYRFDNGLLYITPDNENIRLCFNNISVSAKEHIKVKIRIKADIDTKSSDKRFLSQRRICIFRASI